MRIALLSIFAFAGIAAGAEEATGKGGDPYARLPADLKVVKGIVFKQVGETKLDLMLLLPTEKKFEKSPLVVFIHGGGFGGGDKFHVLRRDALGVARGLTQRGVTFASIEYRLANGGAATVNESVADCKDAVRFLVKHAAEYNLDPERIGTFGESAGGNLTLTTALGADRDYPCDPALDGPPGKIRCVAAYYGPVSFVDPALTKGSNFEHPERLVSILGGPLETRRELAKRLSPIELLRPDSPAIFLAHGDADKTIAPLNSTAMRDAAQAKGVPVECVVSKGAGHGFSGEGITPTIPEINQRTVDFFLKYLTSP
ncbi:MAG: alpha/beta hydrolase [Chthoniobacter sp.]|uniref:alpha/beta hydrolase n=1 Tax=Chthoniobacter sp. TaxID=2510640 RepID=UPI0032A2F5F9